MAAERTNEESFWIETSVKNHPRGSHDDYAWKPPDVLPFLSGQQAR